MSKSPLRGFNYRSIDELLEEGVDMVYDYNHYMTEGGESWGIWHYDKYRVYIYPRIKEKKDEDVTIVHEWLHAYEHITLGKIFRDTQIDWWAYYHLRRDKCIAEYIRSFFPDFRTK